MPDFGAHTPYIFAAYSLAALVLGGLVITALAARASARRRLAALEPRDDRA